MFTGSFSPNKSSVLPKEGDLYKEIAICGKTFKLFYGYYEDFERYGQYNEPMPIYPDFIKEPVYTDNGIPFVTAMQDICKYYEGESESDSCSECRYFQKSEDLFGLCNCPSRQNNKDLQSNVLNE